MARIVINTSSPNDGLGDSLRQAITDVNAMTAELYSTVVFQEAGKGLSSNDFTGTLQTKLNDIAAGAEVNVQADLLQADSTADSFVENKDALLPASPLSVMSGLAEGALLTINTDTSKFNRAVGIAYIVDGHSDIDNPTVQRVAIEELLAITTPFLATHEETYVAVDINGNNYLTAVPLTPTERRNYVRLGVLIHKDNATITAIDFQPTVNIEAGAQIQDILEAIGFISKSGNRIFPVGTNLKIKKEIGTVFKSGANFKNLTTQPHSFILPAQDPITFNYRTQTGVELATTTDINPAIIDINGTFTAMPSTATFASIQRVFIFQDSTIVIQPGQRSFVDLPTAINLINSGVFINDTDVANNGLYLGAIAITRNNTNLSNIAEVIFIPSMGTSVNGSVSAPALGYTAEDQSNKQNNLNPDGTGAKYPTIDAIIASVVTLFGNQSIFGIKSFINRMLVGTATDNGVDALQVTGSIRSSSDIKLVGDIINTSGARIDFTTATGGGRNDIRIFSPDFITIQPSFDNLQVTTGIDMQGNLDVGGVRGRKLVFGQGEDYIACADGTVGGDVNVRISSFSDIAFGPDSGELQSEFNQKVLITSTGLIINSATDNLSDSLQVTGTAVISGETKILDLAGSGNRNVSAAASGILVINTVYSVFADNTAAIAGGLQLGEFYRTSTGALFVRF